MPQLRLVVLALQDRLAYGPTFESAMAALFGGAASALSAAPTASTPSAASAARPAAAAGGEPSTDLNTLIADAARDLADYQKLTAEGKLGDAGQKLEALKQKLEQLNRLRR